MNFRKCDIRLLKLPAVLAAISACALVLIPPCGMRLLHAASGSGTDGGSVAVEAEIRPERQEAGGEAGVFATVRVPDTWYLYEHMMRAAVDDSAGMHVELLDVDWPQPETKYDPHLEEEIRYYAGTFEFTMRLRIMPGTPEGELLVPVRIGFQACTPQSCFIPENRDITLSLTVTEPDEPVSAVLSGAEAPVSAGAATEGDERAFETATAAFERRLSGAGPVMMVLMAFLAGLALSLTPCVYPMIPVTIAVIGASRAPTRFAAFLRSVIYVAGISFTYSAAGLLAAATGAAFGIQLQHPLVYLALALLFFVFALAMFGVFEINLPLSWQSRLQAGLRGRGGLPGIFLTGAVSGIVVTSCAAPVVFAAIGYIIASADLLQGFLIFTAIAWGMGVPLIVAGTFSGVLSGMPESGIWQRTVRNIMGLALAGASLYFVYLGALLPPAQFALLLGAALVVTAVFTGAFDRVRPEDGRRVRLRKAFGILLLFGAAYVVFPQMVPQHDRNGESIDWLHSIEEAFEMAEELDRPVMMYFSTEHCPACRRLERRTFPDRAVVEESKRFVNVRFDAVPLGDEGVRAVLSEYDIRGFPSILFADSGGTVMPHLTEVRFLRPDAMAELMGSAYEYLAGE